MRRMTSVLSKTPHKYIVSKGPRADLILLPENMWGDQYLPQTKILPIVDLVITHGKNKSADCAELLLLLRLIYRWQ